jgi:hypothetical protein
MARIRLLLWAAGVATLLGLASAGCSRPARAPRGNDAIKPSYNATTGRLERITYDRNHDGKVDAWLSMDGTRVVRAELDENFDGTPDRWEYYESGGPAPVAQAGAPPVGVLSKVEVSTKKDGKPSRVEFFERGQRVRAEEDTDGDGKVDSWETWVSGAGSQNLLDTDGDGRPDRRLTYPQDGSSPLFEKADADGRFPTP